MMAKKIKAFIGHSFFKKDDVVFSKFVDFFNSLDEILECSHAKKCQPKSISEKVKQSMLHKDLFIGILTKKYNLGLFKKGLPSLWIVQESGYAIGKNLKYIFIVEDVLDEKQIQGLQGDYELIFFNRNHPEKSFSDINQMMLKVYKDLSATEEELKDMDIKSDSAGKGKEKEQKEKVGWIDLYAAIKSRNDKEEEKVFKALTKDALPEHKEMNEACRHFWKAENGDSNAFDYLKKEAADNKFYPNFYLGRYYKESLEDLGMAKDYYSKALKYANKFSQKIDALGKLSVVILLGKEKGVAYKILVDFLTSDGLKDKEKAEVYKLLANLAKINKDDQSFVSFLEASLEYDPYDTEARFDIAYRYSEMNEDIVAIKHYKILSEMNPSGACYNNLAVSYSVLDMNALAAEYYKQASSRYDYTLAMANLAYKYLEIGFLEEAKTILDKAKKEKYCHDNVDSALNKLKTIRKNELEKREKLSECIPEEAEFRIEYAKAYLKQNVEEKFINGVWKFGNCENMELSLTRDILKGKGKILTSFSLGSFGQESKDVTLDGNVFGCTANYSLTIGNKTLLTQRDYKGMMIFYPQENIIKVLEFDKDGKSKIFAVNKKNS